MFEYDEPEWTAENCNRKKGDTTLKTCGWCKYSTGTCRYSCTLDGMCTLMRSYGKEKDIGWDTKCKIINLGKLDIEALIKSKKCEIDNLKNQISYREVEKDALQNLLLKTRYKPPLPSNRPYDYYNEGDIVWIFYEGYWRRGIVVYGYRHHDGCVSYILDDYPESRADRKGPWGCGYAVPGILKDEEILHFSDNYEDFQRYLQLSNREYNGTRPAVKEMMKALFPYGKVYDE